MTTIASTARTSCAPAGGSTQYSPGALSPPLASTLQQLTVVLQQLIGLLQAQAGRAGAIGTALSSDVATGAAFAQPAMGAATAQPTPHAVPAEPGAAEFVRSVAPAAAPVRGARPHDGPGVVRRILPISELERDPALRGKLDPPRGGRPPTGVSEHTRGDGTRVLTINIHAAVPAGNDRSVGRESIDGLRDVAAYVNASDADVVLVQEMRRTRLDPKRPGIGEIPSVFAHLIGADDMAFTPFNGSGSPHLDGTATYTRNGYTIPQAINVDLPDDPTRPIPRSAGVMAIQPPGGGEAFTVVNAHLSHMAAKAPTANRVRQLAILQRVVESVRADGSFGYDVVGGQGRHATATGFPARVLLGGDLNTPKGGRSHWGGMDSPDRILGKAGMRHVADLARRGAARPGIDHVYALGFDVGGTSHDAIAARELRGRRPTDHAAYVVDVR